MLPTLSPDESRVLGTLIEKAQTTPNQYPLTLNALVTGVNQRNNRWPVVTIDDDRALSAIDGLRSRGLLHEVSLAGSRVQKFRHVAREALAVTTSELVILAELLLRGPQTVGEIRGRASRMHALESIEVVETLLGGMGSRQPPLVRELPPSPGSRAPRWMQLLCPELHPLDSLPIVADSHSAPADPDRVATLEGRIASLEGRIAELDSAVEDLRRQLGA
jgi:uncharacterized protein YceH (UPF0502 family)